MQSRYCDDSQAYDDRLEIVEGRLNATGNLRFEDGGEGWFVDLVKPILFRESPTQKSVHLSRVKIHDARSLAADL